MKRKLLVAILSSILAILFVASPCFATYIIGVHFNKDAVGNEWALWVDWGDNKPDTIVNANEFQSQKIKGKWETVADIENRIQDRFNDFLVEDVLWNQLDQEEEPYLSGQFSKGEELYVDPQTQTDYCRYRKMWFAIHIYSLDDLETPESELNFTTRFYNAWVFPGNTHWEQVYPDGWWD